MTVTGEHFSLIHWEIYPILCVPVEKKQFHLKYWLVIVFDRCSCCIESPPLNLDQTIVCKRFLMVARRMCAIHLEKQQKFTVFCFTSVSTWAKGVQRYRGTTCICPGSPCSSSFHSELSLYAEESSWVLFFTRRHTFLKTVVLVPLLASVLNYGYTAAF